MSNILLKMHSEQDTQSLAVTLANKAQVGDVIYLQGTLGMGKSTFARAFIRHLAQNPTLEVPSPTFTLVQNYDIQPLPVCHFDLYRLESPEEIEELGLEEALATAISLIEWPERLGTMTLSNTLILTFKSGENSKERVIQVSGSAPWHDRLKDLSL